MKREDLRTKVSGKWITAVLVAFAATLLGLFITAAPGMATPVTAAQVANHSLGADVRGAATAGPDIEGMSCDNPTAFHLRMSTGEYCFGYDGVHYFAGNTTYSACAGNNYGTLWYFDYQHATYETWDFAPGHAIMWSDGVDVLTLTITGYRGEYDC
jgi:hypothetical protein